MREGRSHSGNPGFSSPTAGRDASLTTPPRTFIFPSVLLFFYIPSYPPFEMSIFAVNPSFSSLSHFFSSPHVFVLFFNRISPLNFSSSRDCSHAHTISLFSPLSFYISCFLLALPRSGCLLFFLNLPLSITSLVFCQASKTNLLWFTFLKALFPPVSVSMHQPDKELYLGQGLGCVYVCM